MAFPISDFVHVNFTTTGISKVLGKSDNVNVLSPFKDDIVSASKVLENTKIDTKEPIGFTSIPELVGLDYVGYIIEKERLNKATGDWLRTDEYKIIGSRAIDFKDTRIAYGEVYRYRIKSIVKLTVKKKKNITTNFDILTDLQTFIGDKVKEDFQNATSLVKNRNSLFNKGLDSKVSSGVSKPSVNVSDRFSIVFNNDNTVSVVDTESKKQTSLPLDKQKDLLSSQMLFGASSKIDLKELLNKVIKNQKSEQVEDFECVSYYYSSRPSKNWVYVDIIDQEPPESPLITKIIPNSLQNKINIYWTKPITFKRNVKFLNIYRRNKVGDEWMKIAESIPEEINFFIDDNVEFNKKYIYAMTTIDVHDIESFLSTQIQAELNPNISLEKEEKALKWISGPGATIEDTESVFRKFFTRDEQIIAKNNVVFVANTKFSDESKDFIVRIRSLDTHESFDIKLTLKNIKEI